MNLEQELARALEAQRWLDDKLFIEARDGVYGQLRAARQNASTTDHSLHSQLILMEQMADLFFGHFEKLAQTGRFAQLELETRERRARLAQEGMQNYFAYGRNGL